MSLDDEGNDMPEIVGDILDRLRRASHRPGSLQAPEGTVSLAVGDPDFSTPAPIVDAAIEALRAGYTHYADWLGDPELRAVIVENENRWADEPYEFDEAMVGHGANGVLMAAVFAVVKAGDRVVVPDPTYSLYTDHVAMAGAEVVDVPLLADLHVDLGALDAALTGARMLVLCNPGNPTGAVLGRSELEAIARMAVRHDVIVLVDEAYGDLVYDGVEFARATSIPGWHDRLISVQTLSKTYAMTGWRVGYALAPAQIAGGMRQVHAMVNGAVNTTAQRAAVVALRHGPSLAAPMLVEYARRRARVLEWIEGIDGLDAIEPEGSFYVFCRYALDLPSAELARRLVREGVAVRPGSEYGPHGEGYIRLSFATDISSIDEGMRRLKAYFAAH